MAFFARINPSQPEPRRVLNWYDTEQFSYATLPPEGELLELTPEQWAGRLSTPFVQGGVLVAAPPPGPPSLAQRAAAVLGGGLVITSAGTPAINGTYRCDEAARATMAEVGTGIAAGAGFPGGFGTFDFDLIEGHVTFVDTACFLRAAIAVRDFVYQCNQVIRGRSTTLPAAAVTIA